MTSHLDFESSNQLRKLRDRLMLHLVTSVPIPPQLVAKKPGFDYITNSDRFWINILKDADNLEVCCQVILVHDGRVLFRDLTRDSQQVTLRLQQPDLLDRIVMLVRMSKSQ